MYRKVPRVRIPRSPPFFCKKMANEAARLHFTVPSGTTSLKKQSFFFTSSPNSRSLTCEVAPYSRLCRRSAPGLVPCVTRPLVCVTQAQSAIAPLVKLPPVGGWMCFFFTALRLHGGFAALIFLFYHAVFILHKGFTGTSGNFATFLNSAESAALRPSRRKKAAR